MTKHKVSATTAVAAASLLGTAGVADEVMSTEQLSALITGNTLYVDMPAGSPGAPDGGTAPIFYAADGAAAALLPAGMKLVGAWALGDAQYCIDWENGPKNSCTTLVRGSDGFQVVDANKGEPRGMVARIATGNPENL